MTKPKPKNATHVALIKKNLEQSVASLEQEYVSTRKQELETLHNKLVDVLAEYGASPQNTLLVLEMLKEETLHECMEKFFGSSSVESHNAPKAPRASSSSGPGLIV